MRMIGTGERMFSLYIVDCIDVLYVGITSDPVQRALDHFLGHGSNTTKKHKPVDFMIVTDLLTKEQALAAETALVELLRNAGKKAYGGGYVENRECDSESGLRKAKEPIRAEAADRKMLT